MAAIGNVLADPRIYVIAGGRVHEAIHRIIPLMCDVLIEEYLVILVVSTWRPDPYALIDRAVLEARIDEHVRHWSRRRRRCRGDGRLGRWRWGWGWGWSGRIYGNADVHDPK